MVPLHAALLERSYIKFLGIEPEVGSAHDQSRPTWIPMIFTKVRPDSLRKVYVAAHEYDNP